MDYRVVTPLRSALESLSKGLFGVLPYFVIFFTEYKGRVFESDIYFRKNI